MDDVDGARCAEDGLGQTVRDLHPIGSDGEEASSEEEDAVEDGFCPWNHP